MDIMELGAIGELVGGLAVIGTLMFVAFQVRQATTQTTQQNTIARAEANRSVATELNRLYLKVCDPEFGPLYRRSLLDFEGLSKEEQVRIDSFWSTHVNQVYANWMLEQTGLVDGNWAESTYGTLVGVLKTTGGAYWWGLTQNTWPQPFVVRINQEMAQTTARAFDELMPWYAGDAASPAGA